jgi:hypothetical protein
VAVACAGEELDDVLLDALASASPVAPLPAEQFGVDEIQIEGEPPVMMVTSAGPCDSPAVW